MLRLQSLTALCLRNVLATRAAAISSSTTCRAYSKDSDSDSDDEKSNKKSKKPKIAEQKQQQVQQKTPAAAAAASAAGEEESAATRLNKLLASMQTDDNLTSARNVPKIARPGEANKKRKEAVKHEAASKDIFAAAKNVAAMLNGDNAGEEVKKQTESELLAKLLGHKPEGEAAGGAQQTEPAEELSLSDLIVGMKIDRRQQPKVQTRADHVRRSLTGRPQQQQQQKYDSMDPQRRMRKQQPRAAETYTGSVNLFGGEPLGIFQETTQLNESNDILSTWQHLQAVELQLQVTHPPANYYEKIALWTEQGKVWRFPIDNEQDYAEERDVDFTEHIFLEQHLEDWCPSKGPVRHFMELVCVGLSKNPYITAKDKKEHILWYRDYFMAKRDILKDLIDKDKMNKISKNTEQSSQLEA